MDQRYGDNMTKTYHGSCVCGAVRFEADLDLTKPTTRCNCSFCKKARMWFQLAPGDALRVTAGASSLADYQRTVAANKEPFLHFTFCRTCGARPFTRGGAMRAMPDGFHAVNLACLDDASEAELAAAPIHYADGAHDAWEKEAEHRYL